MTRKAPKPTEAELAILQVLWEKGPRTVRDVHEALSERRTGYTTVLKLMQIMAKKGLVRRDDTHRSHVYEANLPKERTERQLVTDLLDRAFRGSAERLVMRALESRQVSAEELARIKQLLDQHERGK
jgi:predicted transcriptional regulator